MDIPFEPAVFYKEVLEANQITSAFGVPDSSISGLLSFFSATKSAPQHIVTANEGAAVALSAGYYLSTGKLALAYMQNSGLSNALNPLQSLAAKEVYGIPMVLLIGWRGKPGIPDEPQHALIGPCLLDILAANRISYREIPNNIADAKETIRQLIEIAVKTQSPVALVVPPKAFREYTGSSKTTVQNPVTPRVVGNLNGRLCSETGFPLTREAAIRCILEQISRNDKTVSSVGGNSRELYMVRKERRESFRNSFLCIGAMGHTYALAYAVATAHSQGRVFCIDGDGSFIMHAGNNAVLAGVSPQNLIHVIIYNGMHSSTGSQPLMLSKHHLLRLADGLPYEQKFVVQTEDTLKDAIRTATKSAIIIVGVNAGMRKDLPRPTESPGELKKEFVGLFTARL
ncbi:MAG: hypothetical protein ASARMPREDX12_006603 [Alectoria sarmentosa]|nr:MAG: hypothetical protein ASARMPRED_006184 [Alectoria sarmentosa]CAD6592921.1 MAG: hypothetical protein ASARMPREDX12_006603 [Alectoria sarmentosa]